MKVQAHQNKNAPSEILSTHCGQGKRAFRTHFTVVLFQETSLYCYVLFIGKEPPEATFTGNEFLTYDLAKLGGEPILSTKDEISLYFRTNRDDGLLFYTGKI